MQSNQPIKSIYDLRIYKLAFDLAMDVFKMTANFPKEEKYSLTDQVRRSSRSVAANIREGFAKKHYKKTFTRHLVDALGSSEETITWIEFALSCGYISEEQFNTVIDQHHHLSSMIANFIKKWEEGA